VVLPGAHPPRRHAARPTDRPGLAQSVVILS
jgi:hypothetical protein